MSQYFTILTEIGQAKLANALALNTPIALTEMAVGDGQLDPVVSQTTLQNETYRNQLNQLVTDPDNPNYLVSELVIPSNVGGFTVREAGLFDADSNLIAIAKLPEAYKPELTEGAGKELVVKLVIEVANTDSVELKIDPTVVLANREWVDGNYSFANQVPGGNSGQVLMKASDTSGDVNWETLQSAIDQLVASGVIIAENGKLEISKNVPGSLGPVLKLTNDSGNASSHAQVQFQASDGSVLSYIRGGRDGSQGSMVAIGTNFFGSSPVDRVQVSERGNVNIGGNSNTRLYVESDDTSVAIGKFMASNSNYASRVIESRSNRTQSSSYQFYTSISGGGDVEHNLRGDGQAYADGSWNSGGADYAEYFEALDGKSIDYGQTVVLENGKVRVALKGEAPFGVIRPASAPSVIGNNKWSYWKGKYLMTPFEESLCQPVKYVKWMVDQTEDIQVPKKETLYKVDDLKDLEITPPDSAEYFEELEPILNPEYDSNSKQSTD